MTKNELKKLRHVATEAQVRVIERELMEIQGTCYVPSDPEYQRINRALDALFAMRDATYELLRIYGLHHL